MIGKGAVVRGDVTSSGEVVIQGRLEGTLRVSDARVTVAKEAEVKADIFAQEVLVLGRVQGNLRASGRVELRSSADVTGDIYTRRLAMEPDAVVRGRVDPTAAEEQAAAPAKASAPGTATASTPKVDVPAAAPAAAGSAAGASGTVNK